MFHDTIAGMYILTYATVLAHPDSFIHKIMLKNFAKRLQRNYGFEAEDFYKVRSTSQTPRIVSW